MLGGNLTRDPELRQLPSGTAVCDFSVAVNRKFKNSAGEEKEEATFVDCTAWGRTGEVISEYFKVGKPIFVEGRLQYETWEDKQGNKRSKISVTVENFQFVGGKSEGGYEGEPAPRAAPQRPIQQRPPAKPVRKGPADAGMRRQSPASQMLDGPMDEDAPF